MKTLLFLLAVAWSTSLSCSKSNVTMEDLPIEWDLLDYSDMANWAFHPEKEKSLLDNYNLDIAVIDKQLQVDSIISITNNAAVNTGVDVFFVHPTVLSQVADPPQNIGIYDQQEFLISATILAQGGLLARYGRLYAPRYRQSTASTYRSTTTKELQASVISVSYSDIKAAFMDYLTNYNDGNRIILAGHSQGSFLLAMLLRDVFDQDPALREKLVTAALGGMGYIFAPKNKYVGGWWQTIPLCTTIEACGCIHNWRSFSADHSLPDINTALPEFNPNLVDQGLVYRVVDQSQDWFVQDSLYYGTEPEPLRNYIVPDARYNLGDGANFIAFDSLYRVRFRREWAHKVGLSVEYAPGSNDRRPNDLANEEIHPNFKYWGYHRKDYNIYLWALMEQIDSKLLQCE